MNTRHVSLKKAAALALFLGALAQPAWAATVNLDKCTIITKSGTYKLTRDLTASGNCMVIQASDVRLDLGAHILTGNRTGKGVSAPAHAFDITTVAITVTNGSITNFGDGVQLGGTHGAVVTKLQVTSNVSAGIFVGPGAFIDHNTVSENGDSGIFAGAGSTITRNESRNNGANFTLDGIAAGWGSVITGNTVSGNDGDGIV